MLFECVFPKVRMRTDTALPSGYVVLQMMLVVPLQIFFVCQTVRIRCQEKFRTYFANVVAISFSAFWDCFYVSYIGQKKRDVFVGYLIHLNYVLNQLSRGVFVSYHNAASEHVND